MSPMIFAVIKATMLFINHIIEYTKIKDKVLKIYAIVLILCNVILILDMAVAFARYNQLLSDKLDAIHFNPGQQLVIDVDKLNYEMTPSILFNLRQHRSYNW